MASEDQLIERVRRKFPLSRAQKDGLRVGIGDDAAVLRSRIGTECIVTTDAFLENVHFRRKTYPPKALGYKALARATSDIAAMGARPRYFFLTIGLPNASAGAWFDDFLDGMARAAQRFNLVLAGGDTTKYPAVVASLTVLGEADRGRAILRSGARPGDFLCVSGRLGEAELGLRLVQRRLHERRRWTNLLRKHLYPEPRLAMGQWLSMNRCATSMIDTSDGLSTDLQHICKASGVGAVVWTAKIPAVKVPRGLQRSGLDHLEMALHGGEDYELLFTVPKRLAGKLPRRVRGVPMTIIGEITHGKKVVMLEPSGRTTPLDPKGWDPFRKKL